MARAELARLLVDKSARPVAFTPHCLNSNCLNNNYSSKSSQDSAAEDTVGSVLRRSQLSESFATQFFVAQSRIFRKRPDLRFYSDCEREQLQKIEQLIPRHGVRPSLLVSAAKAVGAALGVAAAAAPRSITMAIAGAVQEGLVEQYNQSLREIHEQGVADQAPDVREALRELRAIERAPDGSPAVPDVLTMQRIERLEDVGLQGLVGVAVKGAITAALSSAGKL